MTTTKTIVMNVPFTFDVDVEGEVTPETIRQSILSQREEYDWTETIKDHIDFYSSNGQVRNVEELDEDTIIIDL